MAVSPITPQIVTLEEARTFLGEQQIDPDIAGNLQTVINSVTGWVYEYTGRRYLADGGSTSIVEYVRGDGSNELQVMEYPLVEVNEVVTWPFHDTLGYTIAGPDAAQYDDEMYYDRETGQIWLKNYDAPDQQNAAKVTYKAGFTAGSPELATIKGATLELVQFHWGRHVNNDAGIATKKQGDDSVTYRMEDIDPAVIRQLAPFRRQWP